MGMGLKLSAVNQTELKIAGIVLLDFGVEESDVLFQIPFIVTDENAKDIIIGYNVIENLIANFDERINPRELLKKISNISVSKIEGVVNQIYANVENPDGIGEVKILKDQIIPANCLHRVECQTKILVQGPEITVLFAPNESRGFEDLGIMESPEVLKKGRKQNLNISVYNPSGREVMVKKGTVMGNVYEITQVIPIPETGFSNIDSIPPESERNKNKNDPTLSDPNKNENDPKLSVDPKLSAEKQATVQNLLERFDDVFSKHKSDIGHINDLKMQITLLDKTPVGEPYRKIPKLLYDDVKTHINMLLTNGWITKSTSSYASPIVCVRKKDGGLRLCCDYRKLNLKTIPEQQPIPRVQDILDNLGGQKWFSTLDMSQAYHQGEMHADSRKYTAFSTPWSLYEWVVIPYGLRNAPQTFQRYMNDCLEEVRDKICIAYLDDILVFGETFEKHQENLETILHIFREKGIKLNGIKCEFCKTEIRYLGRLISAEGYRPDPANVETLDNCKIPPKTVGELHSLLGFLGFYRTYVQDFSRKMKPC